MSNPNPYQPSQTPAPLTKAKAIKRGIGVGLLLLLTPPAVIIGCVVGCGAQDALSSVRNPLLNAVLGWTSLFLPPLVVLIAMTSWAACTHVRQTKPHQRGRRASILLLTPIVVVVAAAGGFGLGAAYVGMAGSLQGGVDGNMVLIGLLLFFAPPSLALIGMLWWAWNHAGEP